MNIYTVCLFRMEMIVFFTLHRAVWKHGWHDSTPKVKPKCHLPALLAQSLLCRMRWCIILGFSQKRGRMQRHDWQMSRSKKKQSPYPWASSYNSRKTLLMSSKCQHSCILISLFRTGSLSSLFIHSFSSTTTRKYHVLASSGIFLVLIHQKLCLRASFEGVLFGIGFCFSPSFLLLVYVIWRKSFWESLQVKCPPICNHLSLIALICKAKQLYSRLFRS